MAGNKKVGVWQGKEMNILELYKSAYKKVEYFGQEPWMLQFLFIFLSLHLIVAYSPSSQISVILARKIVSVP